MQSTITSVTNVATQMCSFQCSRTKLWVSSTLLTQKPQRDSVAIWHHVVVWQRVAKQPSLSFDTQCPFHLTWSETIVFVCLLCIKRYVISGSSCALFCYCEADGCFNCFSLCTLLLFYRFLDSVKKESTVAAGSLSHHCGGSCCSRHATYCATSCCSIAVCGPRWHFCSGCSRQIVAVFAPQRRFRPTAWGQFK